MRMRNLLFVFMFMIVLCSFVSAKELHNDWHYSGDSFSVGDDVFLVNHYDFDDDKVLLLVDDVSTIVHEGECSFTLTREYCLEEVYRDMDESEHIKFEGGEAYAGLNIIVNSRGPDIDISRSFSTGSPELDEEVTVTVTLTNEGEESALDFSYYDTYPEEAVFTFASTGIIIDRALNRIVFDDKSFDPSEEKIFKYRFKVKEYTSFSTKGIANYTFSKEKASVSSSSKKISLNKPYSFSLSLSPTKITENGDSSLSIKISNNVEQDIVIDELYLIAPQQNLYLAGKPSEFNKEGEKFVYSGDLKKDDSETFKFSFRPKKSGTYEFFVKIKVIDKFNKTFEENKTIKLTMDFKKVEVFLSLLDTTITEGGIYRLSFSLKNSNTQIGYNNINAVISSNLFDNKTFTKSELVAGQVATLYIGEGLEAPYIDKKTTYTISVDGTYETSTNEEFTFSKDVKLLVTPVDEIITIIPSILDKDLMQGDNTTVTVKIKSNVDDSLTVNVKDTFSEGLLLTGGKSEEVLIFDGKETKQAYTYKLKVPADYDPGEAIIITEADVSAKKYHDEKSNKITIKFKPKEGEEAPKEDKPADKPTTNKPAEKKEGFFTKVINGIKNFFRRLFGYD